jgi:hypothetical protein
VRLARPQRRKQLLRQPTAVRLKRRRHRRHGPRNGQQVAQRYEAVSIDVFSYGDTVGSGVNRLGPARCQHRHLSGRRTGVGGEKSRQRLTRRRTDLECVERGRAIPRLHQSLGCYGPDPGPHPRDGGTDSEVAGLNRHTKLTRILVHSNDGEGHCGTLTVSVIRSCSHIRPASITKVNMSSINRNGGQ